MTNHGPLMDDRLKATYSAALGYRHRRADADVISIHIGQDVWDYLTSFATVATVDIVNTLFGFPVLLEAAWEPQRIEIRATTVIA